MTEADVSARIRAQGQRIKALRLERGLAKPLLASRLGFGTTQAYDLYERGHSIIRLDRVEAWADAFGMSQTDFVSAVLSDPAPWSLEDDLRDAGVPEWALQRAIQAAHDIVPVKRGGTGWISNIQPLCWPCNRRKGSKTIDYRPPEQLSLL